MKPEGERNVALTVVIECRVSEMVISVSIQLDVASSCRFMA